jgi:hypothetical protein
MRHGDGHEQVWLPLLVFQDKRMAMRIPKSVQPRVHFNPPEVLCVTDLQDLE